MGRWAIGPEARARAWRKRKIFARRVVLLVGYHTSFTHPPRDCFREKKNGIRLWPLSRFAARGNLRNGSVTGPAQLSTCASCVGPVKFSGMEKGGRWWKREGGACGKSRS